MVRVTDAVAGERWLSRKFCKLRTKSRERPETTEIADKGNGRLSRLPPTPTEGTARESGTLYIGRYHCNTNNYKEPVRCKAEKRISRAARPARASTIWGSNIWQSDIQMRMTIWMLYLVEFADWNSQKNHRQGLRQQQRNGEYGLYADSMPYHTGTTLASRDSYGLGTQYRYIEACGTNVYDWGDGCYYTTGTA